MWLLAPFIGRYRRRVAFMAGAGVAAVIYGLVEQSTRPEVQAWYWPGLAGFVAFIVTRFIVSRLLGRFVGGVRRHMH